MCIRDRTPPNPHLSPRHSKRKPPVGGSFAEQNPETAMQRPRSGNLGLRAGADLAALQHGIDLTLGLCLVNAILGCDLRHEIRLALESRSILLREFAPLCADVLQDVLLVLV